MSRETHDRERVTPKVAGEYLLANVDNRNLNAGRVERLAGALKRGEWKQNHQAIAFDTNGKLIDGQHRLAAIVQSKVAIPLWVARNCAPDAQEVIDGGQKRSTGDVLKFLGHTDVNALASAGRWLVLYDKTGKLGLNAGSSVSPTAQEVVAKIEGEADIPDYARFGKWFAAQDSSLQLPQSLVSAMTKIFAEKASLEDALEFFNQVLTPRSQSSPAGLLRKRLQRSSKSAVTKTPLVVRAALTIKAWNAFIQGEQPGQLKYAPGGKKPDVFPTIEGGE